MKIAIVATVLAALAAPAAADRWKVVAQAPADLRITSLDGGDYMDLVAGADERSPGHAASAWLLRLVDGAWHSSRIVSDARPAPAIVGVWWHGGRLIASAWTSGGDASAILASDDGTTWTHPVDRSLIGKVRFHAGGQIATAAVNGKLVRWFAADDTWTESPARCDDHRCKLAAVLSFGGTELFGLVAGGVVHTLDAGRHWKKISALPPGFTADAGKAWFADGSYSGAVYLVEDGTLAVSTDGGQTWDEHALPDGASSATLVAGAPSVLFVGGTHVWRSDDAGATWDAEPLAAGAYGAVHVAVKHVYVVRFSDKGGDELLAEPW